MNVTVLNLSFALGYVLNILYNVFQFYGIHIHALIVKFQENTNKCTILQYEVFTI